MTVFSAQRLKTRSLIVYYKSRSPFQELMSHVSSLLNSKFVKQFEYYAVVQLQDGMYLR